MLCGAFSKASHRTNSCNAALDVLYAINGYEAMAATQWHYASSETEVLGLILRAVTGKPVADYLSEKIWQRIGTEADASWAIDGTGQEVTFCCFNAVLRDYARFGRLLAHDGMWNGREVIPRQWLIDATTVRSSDAQLAPGAATKYYGYGYQIWLLPGAERRARESALQERMRPALCGLATMESGNGALCRTGRVVEANIDLRGGPVGIGRARGRRQFRS